MSDLRERPSALEAESAPLEADAGQRGALLESAGAHAGRGVRAPRPQRRRRRAASRVGLVLRVPAGGGDLYVSALADFVAAALAVLVAADRRPWLRLASAGATDTGAVDPLAVLALLRKVAARAA